MLFKRSIDEAPRTKCILFIILHSLQKKKIQQGLLSNYFIEGEFEVQNSSALFP